MVELSNFDIVCCKVPILISTVDDRGYLSNYKHLKKSNAACFYTPIVLKLLIIFQM